MQKIYALIENVNPPKIIEYSLGRLIDDGVWALHLPGETFRSPRTGREYRRKGRFVGFGFLKIWDREKAVGWLEEHTPNLGVQKWLEFDTED